MDTATPGGIGGWFGRLAHDWRAWRAVNAARGEASRLDRARADREAARTAAWKDAGLAAVDAAEASSLAEQGPARAARDARGAAEALRAPRQADLDVARTVLGTQARLRDEAIGRLEAEERRLAAAREAAADAATKAAREVASILAQAANLEQRADLLAAAPPPSSPAAQAPPAAGAPGAPATPPPPVAPAGPTPASLREEAAALRQRLPAAEQASVAAAKTAAEAAAAHEPAARALAQARNAWAEERAALEGSVQKATDALAACARDVVAAEAALAERATSLGRAVAESGLRGPAFDGPAGKARDLAREIEEFTAKAAEARARADAAWPSARRFLLLAGAGVLVLAGVVVAIVLLARGCQGSRSTTVGDAGPASRGPATSDASAAQGTGPGAVEPSFGERPTVTDAIRRAVLALPSVAPREQDGVVLSRVAGEVELLDARPAPGDATRLALRVPLETRQPGSTAASAVEVRASVLVASDGRVLDARTTAVVDEADRELEALLAGG